MSPEKKKLLQRYLISFLAGILITAFGLWIQNYSFGLPKHQQNLMLSNACTLSGTILLGIGCLVFVANHEGFLGLGYALGHTIRMLIPGAGKKDEKYYDYVERKRAKGKVKGYSFLLVTGAVFLLFAVIFMIRFYR